MLLRLMGSILFAEDLKCRVTALMGSMDLFSLMEDFPQIFTILEDLQKEISDILKISNMMRTNTRFTNQLTSGATCRLICIP